MKFIIIFHYIFAIHDIHSISRQDYMDASLYSNKLWGGSRFKSYGHKRQFAIPFLAEVVSFCSP